MEALINGRKNCPGCRNWWFDRQHRGCLKGEGRHTYTTLGLAQYYAGQDKPCPDFDPIGD